ncbi:hypothetical protein CJU90_5480 [Yarrowia sp. C11]|nr:hypothetical protein CJU90_5480 [Yarrowia sp. C11]KAG5364071.1 hypothetical protein CKK34_2859 [Yarrowia sp. E02]
MQLSALALATLLATVNAHYNIYYPGMRGDSHATQTQGPCGGLTKVGERFKINGKSVDVLLKTSHSSAITEYRLCLGDDCGTKSGSEGQKDFKTLYGPINELGAGNFCMPGLPLGDLKDGQKGTIQVIMQAVDGNLYNCIDFEVDNSVDAFNTAVCKNSTGVSAEPVSGANAGSLAENTKGSGNSSGHAHGSASETGSKSSASGSASATSAAASSAASSAAASATAETSNDGSMALVNGALAVGGVVAAALLI